jgi:Type I phosphodiesterase / nucleotide pyrophosphatase
VHCQFQHVLLLSVDGMHERDLSGFLESHPDSMLAELSRHGTQYENAWVNALDGTPTNPSDSFPGLLALTTGGSSPTHGGWYDVSYARELYPYNAEAPCSGSPGTMVSYDESVELDSGAGYPSLWGSAIDDTPTHEPSVVRSRIDLSKLPYAKSAAGCMPVYPHQYIRANTIFEVAHAAGQHTAWSDKHLAYELVTGPSGDGLDDFFAPEVNSVASNLVPSAAAADDYTTNYLETEAYDDFKVRAIVNQVAGKWSDDGLAGASDITGSAPGVPAIFGMNFQAVSVAQKNATADGGYQDAAGTPGAQLADALEHTDASIARIHAELAAHGLLASTLIIVTAKHGQSPIDRSLVTRLDGDAVAALVNQAAPVAGHIEDDVALYWLQDSSSTAAGSDALLSPPMAAIDPLLERVLTSASPDFVRMFGDPARDPRVPDIIGSPKKGVIYSLSTKKVAEHGGFADDDAHVALLLANPALDARTDERHVRTKQVAPTILQALGLDPRALDAVRAEGTEVLPGLDLE